MPIGANRDGANRDGANRDGEFWHKNILPIGTGNFGTKIF